MKKKDEYEQPKWIICDEVPDNMIFITDDTLMAKFLKENLERAHKSR
jgi:hypothetical protein